MIKIDPVKHILTYEDEEITKYHGPHRKLKENEYIVPIKDSVTGRTILIVKKREPKLSDIEDVTKAPWLTEEEKRMRLEEMGVSPSKINLLLHKGLGRVGRRFSRFR